MVKNNRGSKVNLHFIAPVALIVRAKVRMDLYALCAAASAHKLFLFVAEGLCELLCVMFIHL